MTLASTRFAVTPDVVHLGLTTLPRLAHIPFIPVGTSYFYLRWGVGKLRKERKEGLNGKTKRRDRGYGKPWNDNANEKLCAEELDGARLRNGEDKEKPGNVRDKQNRVIDSAICTQPALSSRSETYR